MRVLLVCPYDIDVPGGVVEHLLHLRQGLEKQGHKVEIMAPSSKRAAGSPVEGCHFIGTVVPIRANGAVARITLSPRLSGWVKRVLDAGNFDVIHLHEPLLPALPLTVLYHSQSCNVGTFHAYGLHPIAYFYGRPLLQPFFNRLHGRIAVSEAAKQFVAQFFPADYEIIPNGIDLNRFNPRVMPAAELQSIPGLKVLFVGRFEEPRKGFKVLVKAMQILWQQGADLRLVVVGRGDIDRYAAQLPIPLRSRLLFMGEVSRERLPGFYTACDIFVAPSLGGESQGIVLLEAMASHRPVIASNIPGYNEVVHHGVNGLMVPPGDSASLARAIYLLAHEPDLRRRLADAGSKRAAEFSWDRIVPRIEAHYLRALSGMGISAATHSPGKPWTPLLDGH